ncbi:MAG: amidohydrolase family protein [Pirellulales bacterium]
MSQSLRIDAHHHFWRIGQYAYPWIEPAGVLDRSFGPDELAPLLAQHQIGRSVLVQTIASLDETRWFLELAERHPWIAGVVGWVDLTDVAVDDTLDELITRHGPRLVGLRHNLHDEPDDRWILREDVLRGLAAVAGRGLAYDLLIRPRHLPVVLELISRQPGLRLVIDHAAKPAIAARMWDDWATSLAEVARHPRVFCKLSGLITEADHECWQPADLKPYIDHVLAMFGPARVMFGSDWPVCLLAGSYERVVDAVECNIAGLNASERKQLFGATAEEFYGLQRGS